MEQNTLKCKDTVRKINDKLVALGYNILYNSNYSNILCKTSDVTAESIAALNKNNGSTSDDAQVYIIRKKCSMLQTGTCSSTITGGTCMQTGCKLPSVHCPMYNGNNNSNIGTNTGNNTGSSNDSEVEGDITTEELLEALTVGNYLIRIRPTDTYNGVFLHAIMLHNETCDLKMTFDYGDKAVQEVVDTVIFLTV